MISESQLSVLRFYHVWNSILVVIGERDGENDIWYNVVDYVQLYQLGEGISVLQLKKNVLRDVKRPKYTTACELDTRVA
jgi:hypothetical protein